MSTNIEDNLSSLESWGVITKSIDIEDELSYSFLSETLGNLIGVKDKAFNYFVDLKIIDKKIKEESLVQKKEAEIIVDEVVGILNDQKYKSHYEVSDDLKDIHISDSKEIDFNHCLIVCSNDEDKTLYQNNNHTFLSSSLKTFKDKGYRISYSFNSKEINFRISKNINGFNYYADAEISNINVSYDFNLNKGETDHIFFKVDYDSSLSFGVSTGKYKNMVIDLKEIESGDIKKIIKNANIENDLEEASLKICTITVPVDSLNTVTINLDVYLKIHINGKIELLINSDCENGFEIKNGQFRLIHDQSNEHELNIGATAKTTLGLNINLNALSKCLMDMELDGGIKAQVKTTLHLDNEIIESEMAYASADDLFNDNKKVKVCGDLSLNWILDLKFNTYRTLLYKYGFNKTLSILDEDNQIFNNLHHIENGVFVEKCTRIYTPKTNKNNTVFNENKIILDRYSIVLSIGDNYEIKPISLPKGYSEKDLIIESDNINIAKIKDNRIIPIISGNCKVKVSTFDGKYNVYVNILVSYE